MSRRLKLVLGLVVLQAAAMLVVLGVTYVASQNMLLRFSESYAARISRDTTAFTEGFLQPAGESARITARLIERNILDPERPADLRRYMLELLRNRAAFDGIYLGREDGSFYYASRAAEAEGGSSEAAYQIKHITTVPARNVQLETYNERLRLTSERPDPDDPYDPRTRPWYIAALEQDAAIWTKPYIFFSSQEPGITTAVPVHNRLGSAPTGAVGVDIKITQLSAFLAALDISPRGEAAIVGRDGDIIAHSLPALMGGEGFRKLGDGGDPILSQAAAQIEGGLATLFPGEIRLARFEAEGEVWLGAVLRLGLDRTPWTVVTYLPESDILAPLHRVRNIALIVSLIALMATALLGYVYGQRVMAQPKAGA